MRSLLPFNVPEPRIRTAGLPSIPAVLLDLVRSVPVAGNGGAATLAGLLVRDPALAARAIAAGNALRATPWRGPLGLRPLIEELGTSIIGNLAAEAVVRRFFSPFPEDGGRALGRRWRKALLCAALARGLARLTEYPDPEEAELVGLLYDLDTWLSLDEHGRPVAAGDADDAGESGGERSHVARLMQQWSPDSFASDALLLQHEPLEAVEDGPLLIRVLAIARRTVEHEGDADGLFARAGRLLDISEHGINELWQLARFEVRELLVNHGFDGDATAPPVDDERARMALGRQVRAGALAGLLLQASDRPIREVLLDDFFLFFEPQALAYFEYDAQAKVLRGVDARGICAPQLVRQMNLPMEPGRTLAAEACLQGKPLASTDSGLPELNSGLEHQLRRLLGGAAWLALPLMLPPAHPFGVVVLGMPEARWQSLARQRDLLEQFATVAAERVQRDVYQLQVRVSQLEEHLSSMQSHANRLIHEACNPLGVIKNYLEVLALNLESDSEKREQLEIIGQEIDRVGDILHRLRDLGNEPEVDDGSIDLNSLIDELVGMFRTSLFTLRRIECSVALDERLPVIRSNRNLIRQVLTNLLKNAAEALEPGHRVSVETRDKVNLDGKHHVQIVVADDGPGLPEDVLANVFSPVVSRKGAQHSGLGLVIVKNLVSQLDGRIMVFSTPGVGTRFEILLPREVVDA